MLRMGPMHSPQHQHKSRPLANNSRQGSRVASRDTCTGCVWQAHPCTHTLGAPAVMSAAKAKAYQADASPVDRHHLPGAVALHRQTLDELEAAPMHNLLVDLDQPGPQRGQREVTLSQVLQGQESHRPVRRANVCQLAASRAGRKRDILTVDVLARRCTAAQAMSDQACRAELSRAEAAGREAGPPQRPGMLPRWLCSCTAVWLTLMAFPVAKAAARAASTSAMSASERHTSHSLLAFCMSAALQAADFGTGLILSGTEMLQSTWQG